MSLVIIRITAPWSARFAHQAVNFGLGADVDAAGGLVEDHHLGSHGEPFAEDDFLLVAAAEIESQRFGAGRFDVERANLLGRRFAFPIAADQERGGETAERRERGVFADGHFDDEAFAAAIFGNEIDAAGRWRRAAYGSKMRRSPRVTSARPRGSRPTMALAISDAAGADEAGETENFAARGVEGNVFGRGSGSSGRCGLAR